MVPGTDPWQITHVQDITTFKVFSVRIVFGKSGEITIMVLHEPTTKAKLTNSDVKIFGLKLPSNYCGYTTYVLLKAENKKGEPPFILPITQLKNRF